MSRPSIAFYYEFASTYSYLAAMRIEEAAAARGVAVEWTPFLLGPVFATQGWTTSPFLLYPAKGVYMWRDLARLTAELGLPFRRPEIFPQNGLRAARLALVLAEDGLTPRFSRAVYAAQFGEGRNIADDETLGAILKTLGYDDPAAVIARTGEEPIKQRLKDNVAAAQGHGIFGAPSFVAAGDELFWGNDRLEAALDWALAAAR